MVPWTANIRFTAFLTALCGTAYGRTPRSPLFADYRKKHRSATESRSLKPSWIHTPYIICHTKHLRGIAHCAHPTWNTDSVHPQMASFARYPSWAMNLNPRNIPTFLWLRFIFRLVAVKRRYRCSIAAISGEIHDTIWKNNLVQTLRWRDKKFFVNSLLLDWKLFRPPRHSC